MQVDTVSSLKYLLRSDRNLKICILDNNMIEILTRISSIITVDRIFAQYDIILIPGWVYEEWLDKLYKEGFESRVLTNGRTQKKNAGEISICVLATLLSIYYENFENITIFSFDGDTYNFALESKRQLLRDEKFRDCILKPITYKSNDVLIHEWLRQGLIGEEDLESIVDRIRQSRKVKYTKQAPDLAIEENEEVLDNLQFCQLILQCSLHIVF